MPNINDFNYVIVDPKDSAQKHIKTRGKVHEFGDIVTKVASETEGQTTSPEEQTASAQYRANIGAAHLLIGTGQVTSEQVSQLENAADFHRRATGGDPVILGDALKAAEQVANNGDTETGGTIILSVTEFLDKATKS